MKLSGALILILSLLTSLLSSCEAITGIFKAGMGFGIFIVVAIIIAIVAIVIRFNKQKS